MHICKVTTKLRWDPNNEFYFEGTADWKGRKSATVLRRYESGKVTGRYLYCSVYCGWLVCFPGENFSNYYGYQEKQKEEDFVECDEKMKFFLPWTNEESDLVEIAERRPELRYLCRKYACDSVTDFIKTVHTYKAHPEIEPLVQLGMTSIVNNKNFWRMKDSTRKDLCKWIKVRIPEIEEVKEWKTYWGLTTNFPLCEVLSFRKDGRNIKEQLAASLFQIDHKQYKYIINKKVEPSDYENYLRAVRNAGHSSDDAYWRFPNNFQKQFDKVNRENAAIDKIKDLSMSAKFGDGISKYANLSKKTARTINGMRVYIPCVLEDIIDQAESLNQCLVRNGFIEKMATLESVLIFVKGQDGSRLATAEINWDKKLIQIYGHEYDSDREKSAATPQVKEAVSIFIKKARLAKPHKTEVEKIEDDGLYFKGVTKDLTDMYRRNKYEPGMIFDTGCPDSMFTSDCRSTKKAIHFCKDPNNICKFFGGAEKYLVIKALGKVFHTGDEYISNRIQIVSVLNVGAAS